MAHGFEWSEEIWQKHFGEPLLGDGAIERVDVDTYFRVHQAEMMEHFPKEVFFDMKGILSEAERQGVARLAASEGGSHLVNSCIVRHGGQIAAMFMGHLLADGVYRMRHSHVHPAARGRGLYTEIVRRTLAYSREIGCIAVVSEHAPCNNPILIAKLKAGFRVVGLEVDPAVGVSIRLRYFHNAEHLAAYEFRCGIATLDETLLRNGAGAMPLLIEQVRRGSGIDS